MLLQENKNVSFAFVGFRPLGLGLCFFCTLLGG